MTNEEIARFFNTTRPFIQGNPDLRDPQVEGWFRTRQHFRNSTDHAILQIPVGCGKTGLMALLPFETAQGRVLVISPNLLKRDKEATKSMQRRMKISSWDPEYGIGLMFS